MSPRPRWTFVTNHGAVLTLIGEYGQITAREIAFQLGITERAVRQIIKDLEDEGYIEKRKVGRANAYHVHLHLPLRREDRRHVAVGDLVRVLSSVSSDEEGTTEGDGGSGALFQ
ncbi:MAG: winged helix-turn-helix transcriptional regulator [Chloroflexi bacterium]|nr:winged helix-turn-helix transcriptional regulator [Chloroflexota bacterium]